MIGPALDLWRQWIWPQEQAIVWAAIAPSLVIWIASKWADRSLWMTFLLQWPGTVLHEAAHWIVGLITLAGPKKFSVWPAQQDGHWRLGYVSLTNLNWVNGAFVSLAPLLLVPGAALILRHGVQPAYLEGQWLQWLGWSWVMAAALRSCTPSPQDWKLALPSLTFYTVAAGFALYVLEKL